MSRPDQEPDPTPANSDEAPATASVRRRARGRPARSRRGRPRRASPATAATAPIVSDEDIDARLFALARALAARDGLGRYYTLGALHRAWTTQPRTPQDLHRLEQLLKARAELFQPHRRTPGLYRVRLEVAPRIATAQMHGRRQRRTKRAIARHRASGEPLDQNTALMVARDRLESAQGLHKISARTSEGILEIAFHFPATAKPRHAKALTQIAAETGWQVEVRDAPHHGALSEAATARLPSGWRLLRNPAVRVEERRVCLVVEADELGNIAAQEAAQAFLERTGFSLSFMTADEFNAASPDSNKASPALAEGRMEINLTYDAIREVMEDAAHDVLKTSFRGDHVEVGFISPQIGARYRELLDEVEELTGWTLTIKPHADQHRIKMLARELVPKTHALVREPRFIAAEGVVRVQLSAPLNPAAAATADAALRERTGYGLVCYVKE